MKGSPRVVVGFQCSPTCQEGTGSTTQRRLPPQKSCSLLSIALQQNLSSQHCDGHAHYTDEYETDDEFFCEEDEDAEAQQHEGSHCSSSSSCSDASLCAAASLCSSDPIDIPYKRGTPWWTGKARGGRSKPYAVYTASQLQVQRQQQRSQGAPYTTTTTSAGHSTKA